MHNLLIILLFLIVNTFIITQCLVAQSVSGGPDKEYSDIVPFGDNPSIGFLGKINDIDGRTLFNANPTVRLSFWNSFRAGLQRNDKDALSSFFVFFDPQVRMYLQDSKPVFMPSYRIALAHQSMKQISVNSSKTNYCYVGSNFEFGHFSNGQYGSAFNENAKDMDSLDKFAYNSINDQTKLTDIINRRSGNFDIPLYGRLDVFYKWLNDKSSVTDKFTSMITISLGVTHFFLDDRDIDILPRNRIHITADYYKVQQNAFCIFKWMSAYSVKVNYDYQRSAHPSIECHRLNARLTTYLNWEDNDDFGLFVEKAFGYDDYNLRLVDTGSPVFLGFTWNLFPPTVIGK